MMREIRLAHESDFCEIQHLDEQVVGNQEARSDKLLNFIRHQNCKVVLVEDQIVSYLAWSPLSFRKSDFMNLLIVDPNYRRQGHPSALLSDFQNNVERLECWTSTNASNSIMRALLDKCGWIDSGYTEELDPGDPDLYFVFHNEER